jgi:hypothetical protein
LKMEWYWIQVQHWMMQWSSQKVITSL